MSITKKWITLENVQRVLRAYRSVEAPTLQTIAHQLETNIHTVCWILTHRMPHAEHEALKKLRYSRSKMGKKNPQFGKTGKDHPNWIDEVADGHGYLTCLVDGKRVFVHRVAFAKALGIKVSELSKALEVHHINEDPTDNSIDNLALVTSAGHKSIHLLQRMEAKSLRLKKLSLWDAFRYTTSR